MSGTEGYLELKDTKTGEISQLEIVDAEARRQLENKLDKGGSDKVTADMLDDNVQEYIAGIIADAPGPFTSTGTDYAEVGVWSDGNLELKNRVGYFVTAENGGTISIANSKSAIVGVTTTIDKSGFVGSYSKGDENNHTKGVVAIVGHVNVIDNGTCTVGERCMPADDGTAEPSSNNCGYLVTERVDSTHVRILVSPVIDMVQRIKTDMENIGNKVFEPITEDSIIGVFDSEEGIS